MAHSSRVRHLTNSGTSQIHTHPKNTSQIHRHTNSHINKCHKDTDTITSQRHTHTHIHRDTHIYRDTHTFTYIHITHKNQILIHRHTVMNTMGDKELVSSAGRLL